MRKCLNKSLKGNTTVLLKNQFNIRINPLLNNSTKNYHFLNTQNYANYSLCKIIITQNKLKNYPSNKKLLNSCSFNFSEFISHGGKLKFNLFIKENSKLEDLKFKEEIFEYVALKANEMTEKDIITALKILEPHTILEAELKEFKFFIRNILEVQSKFKSEFAVAKFIKYFLKTYNKDLKKLFDPNSLSIENNKYDLNFSNIIAGLINFALANIMKLEDNVNIKYVLDLLQLINFTENKTKKEFLEKLQIKFLQNINLNLANSPFNLNGIFNREIFIEVKEIEKENSLTELETREEDLNMFLLMNIVVYQDNRFFMDETLKEIFNYFEFRLAEKYGLIRHFDQELNTRPQVLKMKKKELKIFNLIYGFLNNWVEAYKKINKENKLNENEDKVKIQQAEEAKENENRKLDDSLEVNLIVDKEQLDSIQRLLRTIEKIILRNNKITKQAFLKKFKDDSIRYKETVNKIEEVNIKLLDKIISDMEKFDKDH